MNSTHRVHRRSAFTLLELLIVLLLVAIIALIGFPALNQALNRTKISNMADQTRALMQGARFEAIKRSSNARVEVFFTTGEVLAYVDRNGNAVYDPTTDPNSDNLIGRFPLATGVLFHGPGNLSTPNLNAFTGFAATADGAVAIFQPDGSVAASGAFRFRDQRGNILATLIASPATARISVLKFDGDPEGTDDAALYIGKDYKRADGTVGWRWD